MPGPIFVISYQLISHSWFEKVVISVEVEGEHTKNKHPPAAEKPSSHPPSPSSKTASSPRIPWKPPLP